MTRWTLNPKVDLQVQFSAYVKANHDMEVTNNMKDQTHGYISLGTTGNIQGFLKCFYFFVGVIVVRCVSDVFPMPNWIVELVNEWG